MSEYPDAEEEFELMYGDELELIHDEPEDFVHVPAAPKVRKSLQFHTEPEKFGSSDCNMTPDFDETANDREIAIPLDNSGVCQSISDSAESTSTILHSSDLGRKRSAAEVFGDIADIELEEEIEHCQKRCKFDKHEKDLNLIEHILEMRRLNRENLGGSLLSGHAVINQATNPLQHITHNLSLNLPKYPFVTLKKHDGVKVYVRCHSEQYEKEELGRILDSFNSNIRMTTSSGDEMWAKANEILNSRLNRDSSRNSLESSILSPEMHAEAELWVEKYKPSQYMELLSEESTNRILLKWIKSWDKAVFSVSHQRRRSPQVTKKGSTVNRFKKFDVSTKLDEFNRPEHKLVLMSGAPGLGKTTLANVVAAHAGYRVVEVNASEERSIDQFKKILESCTQMNKVFDPENRPNCLVFDEIDGAPQATVEYLIKFVTGTTILNNTKKNKQQKKNIPKRPVVCVCNDAYAPCLRSLRQMAFVLNFPATSSARLAERLMDIARQEQIKTNIGAMIALAEKSHNDIRSCLSVLQFYKANSKPLTLSDVLSAAVGQKDVQRGLFDVWNEIFTIPRTNGIIVSPKERMQNILQLVNSFGDHERLAQGIYENFLAVCANNTSIEELQQALEWFVFNDLLQKRIYSNQDYSMMRYLSYAFTVWHLVFAAHQKPKLQYPKVAYEVKQRAARREGNINEILRGMTPTVRCFTQKLSLQLDTLPYLIQIITPPFRTVSLHLYSESEKEILLKVVNIMIDYNLNYVQERTAEGMYNYKLDPDLESIVSFNNNSNQFTRNTLSYSVKQLIAREIELERMRRLNPVLSTQQKQQQQQKTKQKSPRIVRKDFFGRIISTNPTSSNAHKPTQSNDIWYKYKEGHSNAVRKKITISALK